MNSFFSVYKIAETKNEVVKHLIFLRIVVENVTYDGRFSGNIIVVGQFRCGKTSFVQNLDKNRIFGHIETVGWISKIELSKDREEQIRTFSYASR